VHSDALKFFYQHIVWQKTKQGFAVFFLLTSGTAPVGTNGATHDFITIVVDDKLEKWLICKLVVIMFKTQSTGRDTPAYLSPFICDYQLACRLRSYDRLVLTVLFDHAYSKREQSV